MDPWTTSARNAKEAKQTAVLWEQHWAQWCFPHTHLLWHEGRSRRAVPWSSHTSWCCQVPSMGQKGIPWDSVPLTEHVFSLTFRMTASIKAKVRLKRGRQAFRVDSILDNFQFSLPKKKKKDPNPSNGVSIGGLLQMTQLNAWGTSTDFCIYFMTKLWKCTFLPSPLKKKGIQKVNAN